MKNPYNMPTSPLLTPMCCLSICCDLLPTAGTLGKDVHDHETIRAVVTKALLNLKKHKLLGISQKKRPKSSNIIGYLTSLHIQYV